MAAKKPTAAPDSGEALSFEQALERLETIVEQLEGGALSLEDSIARYEEGVRLSRQLGRTLDEAEKRIERLVIDDDGAPTTEPMSLDDVAESDPPTQAPRRSGPARGGGPPELPF
jgi:exodeoxyribonuclease VII small subunit